MKRPVIHGHTHKHHHEHLHINLRVHIFNALSAIGLFIKKNVVMTVAFVAAFITSLIITHKSKIVNQFIVFL